MIKQFIAEQIVTATQKENLPKVDFDVSEPPSAAFGDYSTNAPLRLSSFTASQTPADIAKVLVPRLQKIPEFSKVEFANPGFINFYVQSSLIQSNIQKIIEGDKTFGQIEINQGKKARVEFISANPTGPLHIGNARGGPLGDALASVLESTGFKVLREYIDNDTGNQVKDLGKTLATLAGFIKENEEDLSYKGEYTAELAKKIKGKLGNTKDLSKKQIIEKAGEAGVQNLFKDIMDDAGSMGIKFDLVVHESKLQEKLPAVLGQLDSQKLLKKHEGAVWFAADKEFLKDKDAVVVKSDGSYTYFASDVAYHKEKFESGYELIIDVFGSNTFGHVPKIQALARALGFDVSRLKIILYQYVRVKRGSEIVKMSKRAGNYVTAREVLDEVGKDAFRFFLLSHSPNTHIDFDLELAKQKNEVNPVYYVQYAHARCANILKKGEEQGFTQEKFSGADLSLLKEKEELALGKRILKLPELVEEISKSFAVQHLTTYSIEIADLLHKFYEKHRVISEDDNLTKARLNLILATKIVLRNTLSLLGISAPERM